MRRTSSETNRNRSLGIAVISGLTLLVLALTVFAVASQARSLSSQAERAVQTVENLRVTSLARSELGVASRIVNISPGETEVILGAIDNANAALEAVEAGLTEETSAETRRSFLDFRAAVDRQAQVLTDPSSSEDLLREAELATGESFSTLIDTMRAEQVEAIAGLEADNDLMNLIATVSTFIVAFIVPSAALFVFQALRSAPRELRALRLEHDRVTRRTNAMAATVSSDATALRQLAMDNPAAASSSDFRRRILRFRHVATANGAPMSVRNELTDINEVLSRAVEAVDGRNAVRLVPAAESTMMVDGNQIELFVTELLTNARVHGAGPWQLGAVSKGDVLEIHVVDHGHGLPDDVVDGVLRDEGYHLRDQVSAGSFGYGLIASRLTVESMGGTLDYRRADGRTSLVASFPGRTTEPANTRKLAA